MPQQIGQALFQRLQILLVQIRFGHTAVVLQGADRCHDHHRGGPQSGHPALDVHKFLSPQVRGEARLGHGVVRQLQSHAGGCDGVAPVGDVGEGPAVDEGGGAVQRLDQIGLDGILQQGGHSPLSPQVVGRDRPPVIGIGHNHAGQARLQVGDAVRQAEDRHDLGGHRDLEAVLPGHALHPAPQSADDVAELAVVHIHGPLPGDPLDVDPQGVALLDVVVQHRRQQVVGRADGVEVPGEVEVDVLHGDHLGVAAAGGAALDAEHRPQRRLPQCHHSVLSDLPQAVRQAHGGGGLALSGRCRGDGGHQHQSAVRPGGLLQKSVVDLRLVSAVLLQICLVHTARLRNGGDWERPRLLGDLDVAFQGHGACPPVRPPAAGPACRSSSDYNGAGLQKQPYRAKSSPFSPLFRRSRPFSSRFASVPRPPASLSRYLFE